MIEIIILSIIALYGIIFIFMLKSFKNIERRFDLIKEMEKTI